MKNYKLLLPGIIMLWLSCSTIKLRNEVAGAGVVQSIDAVRLIAKNEGIDHKGTRVGDFVLREDWKNDWRHIKTKIKKFCKSKRANLVEINTIGWGKKGNGFYADGTLYYLSDLEPIHKADENCSINIIRDHTENIIGSAFSIEIGIDGVTYGKLKKVR